MSPRRLDRPQMYYAPEPRRPRAAPNVGVVLANLGTPDAPTPVALRAYLREFLGDPRVVEAPRLLWWLVLRGIILPLRPRRSARLYRSIWTPQGSPLLIASERLARGLGDELRARTGRVVPVALGMRYGRPSLAEAMNELRAAGCRRLLVLPLYPQYSATTTGSTIDALGVVLRRWRWVPELRTVADYHDHPAYVDALAASLHAAWAGDQPPGRIMLSFHGLPRRYAVAGDPYPRQCAATASLLAKALGLPRSRFQLAFQSRFGREPWLKPYTDRVLERWGREGCDAVDVACPGFAVDCLETLEEIAVTNRELYEASGGKGFRYVPCLNDTPEHARALAAIAGDHLSGWV